MTLTDALLTAQLRDVRAERQYTPTSRWFASGVLDCWRKRWYQAERIPPSEQLTCQGMLALDVGSFLHATVQDALCRLHGVTAEVPWRSDTYGGRADLVVTEECPEWPYPAPAVVEIKTVSGYGFKRCAKTPEIRHIMQGLLCANALNAVGALLVYVDRDSLRIVEHWVPLDEGRAARCRDELEQCARLDAGGRLPHRVIPGVGEVQDPGSDSAPWQCRYCSWQGTCLTDGE